MSNTHFCGEMKKQIPTLFGWEDKKACYLELCDKQIHMEEEAPIGLRVLEVDLICKALDKALIFNQKLLLLVLFPLKNIDCGYSLALTQWTTPSEYP